MTGRVSPCASTMIEVLDCSPERTREDRSAGAVPPATMRRARAEGTPVEPAPGLPVVTLAETGEPSIDAAGVAEPTELVVQPLITGAGAPVESGQTVTFHYSGWLLDGTPFDSSWANGAPFTTRIGTGDVIAGWDQGLVGQTVGSQVLLVIPGDLAYGPAGRAPVIPPDATLIFVVDILSAY